MKTFNATLITFTMFSLSNLAFAESNHVVIDRDLSQVIAHDKSLDLRDEQNKRLVRINATPLQTKRGTIVVGQQSAQLRNLETSTTALSLNESEVEPGATIPVNITLNEHGQIQESLTITDSQFDQRVDYQMTVAKLRSDYEHPVQPQCTSPYTVVEGDDSWSVKDDVCRYDVLANIHCTPESPNYNASTEMCSGTHTHSPKYSCPSGYSRSGVTCTKSQRQCRYNDNNYVFLQTSGGCFSDVEYYGVWNGRRVSVGSTYTASGYARRSGGKRCREDHDPAFKYDICGPVTHAVAATPYCNAGYGLTGGTCRKVTTVTPSYSCDHVDQVLLNKICRQEAVTQPVCVPSHPHFDPDNEVCRSYGD